ncbi:MAG: sulfite oxidase-like oxidoreductase [Actinomycetota bacterium]
MTHEKIFRLIETADNFVKYAKPGAEHRAAVRARKRYERAARLAEKEDDRDLMEQVSLRLADLEHRTSLPDSVTSEDDAPEATVSEVLEHKEARVPPGQRVVRGWPVLHEGPIPRFDPATWSMTIDGAVESPTVLAYEELKSLPNIELTSDFHCVTGWTKLDNSWGGVRTRTLLDRARPGPEAKHALVHAEYGYTANVPLEMLLADDAIVAWQHNGKPLAPKHGFPLRLVVPRLYGWKSVKWVRRFELLGADRRGFWEVRGYHNRAAPWLEERYSYQEGVRGNQ